MYNRNRLGANYGKRLEERLDSQLEHVGADAIDLLRNLNE